MDSWKEFDQNPISHSAAHHIVAIAELLEEYGYARVSDVARLLEITRGSVSVTLKGLKQRGLVTEDERRFLGLSEIGNAIAQSVRARKVVMKKLFEDVLGVDAERADRDTCKIEHLVSPSSALHALHFLRYALEGGAAQQAFSDAFGSFQKECGGEPAACCTCDDVCLQARLTNLPRIEDSAESDAK
ncbi:MAG: metal-dependent transcriptional regulator [Planctomycetota bacterium]